MNRLTVMNLPLDGIKRIQRQHLGDHRGFLTRLFCAEELEAVGWVKCIAQVNHTKTFRRGAVRGLHFQRQPYAEMKLVSCIRGEVWDVAVDLRTNSPTFLNWYGEILSADNGCALLIPEGFAHGFQALTEDCEMLYCHSMPYSAQSEFGLNPEDPLLKITWPLCISELSKRDAAHLMINKDFEGVQL